MKDHTMMHPIDDETLMAFADGALDEQRFETIANAVEADPALADRLAALVQGASLARSGYAQLLEPAPAALEAKVRASIVRAGRKTVWRNLIESLRLQPLGAAVVAAGVAIIAVPAGFLLAQADRSSSDMQMLSQPAIAGALDTLLSGESGPLPDGGQIAVIATFTDGAGALCREFETSGAQAYLAIACRTDRHWATRFAMVNTGDDEGAYRPASGSDIVDAFLDRLGASAPLLDEDERAALRPDGK